MPSHKRIAKTVAVLLLLAGVAAALVAGTRFLIATVEMGVGVNTSAQATEQSPHTETIYAGGDIAVGHVYMWEDLDNLYIRYATDAGDNGNWHLTACRAHVAIDRSGIPQYDDGDPKSGAFAYRAQGLNTGEYTFTIPAGNWKSHTEIAVAANCIVETKDGDSGTRTESGWAGAEPAPGQDRADWFQYTLNEQTYGEWWPADAWAGNAVDPKAWEFPGRDRATYLEYQLGTGLDGALYVFNDDAVMAGRVRVSDDVAGDTGSIRVTLETGSGWLVYDARLAVRGALPDIPNTGPGSKNPVPGRFEHSGTYGPRAETASFTVPYDPEWGTRLYICAHATVLSRDTESLFVYR